MSTPGRPDATGRRGVGDTDEDDGWKDMQRVALRSGGVAARRRWAAAIFVFCWWVLSCAPAGALTAAERFAMRAGGEAMAIARADGSLTQVATRFQISMRRYTSVARLAEFSLGPYRRDLPASRRREFQSLVERFAGRTFAAYHRDFIGRKLELIASRTLGAGDTLVTTRIVYDGGKPPAEVAWRVVKTGASLRIFDMKLRGIWLGLQMRSNFVSILKQSRGDMDALFAYLRKWEPS